MLKVRELADVERLPDTPLRALVANRLSCLMNGDANPTGPNGYGVVIQAGDTLDQIEEVTGCCLLSSPFCDERYGDPDFFPCFEVLEEHACAYEIVFIFNDDGYCIVLFVPKGEAIDGLWLKYCAEFAVPSQTFKEQVDASSI